MGKSTISMVIFNSYFDITRGYLETSIISTPSLPWVIEDTGGHGQVPARSEAAPGMQHIAPLGELLRFVTDGRPRDPKRNAKNRTKNKESQCIIMYRQWYIYM